MREMRVRRYEIGDRRYEIGDTRYRDAFTAELCVKSLSVLLSCPIQERVMIEECRVEMEANKNLCNRLRK